MSLSSSGTISYSGSDNAKIKYYSDNASIKNESFNCASSSVKSISGSVEYKRNGTYTMSIMDCSDNAGSCSITVKSVTQKRTASCKTYSRGNVCTSWGAYGNYGGCNYYSDISNTTTTSCRACGNGSKWECKTRSCAAYNITGCSTWNDFGSWSDVDSCTAGESTDYSTKTECQTVYRKG